MIQGWDSILLVKNYISEDEIPLAELKLRLAKSPEGEGTDNEEDMLLSKIQARL